MTVGRPNRSSVNSSGFSVRAAWRCCRSARPPCRLRRPGSADHRVGLGVHGGGVERIVAAADAQEPGALLEGLRPEPRHPLSCWRVRNGAVGVAVGDDRGGQRGVMPETRASSGCEAVFRSTPTAFTQSSTTASSERASCASAHVVLVLPDADGLRVDLDQFGQRILQPPGDRDRAAQRDVQVGQLRARRRPRRSTPTRRPRRPPPWSASSSGWRLIRSAASRSVSREAVPLPMATSST